MGRSGGQRERQNTRKIPDTDVRPHIQNRCQAYTSTRVMWWEIDPQGMLLFVLEKLGLLWEVRWLSENLKAEAKSYRQK